MNSKKLKSIVLLYVLLVGLVLSCGQAAAAGASYNLSMLPRYFPDKIMAMITPLAEYLSKETGDRIVPVLTKDFKDYENQIRSGQIHIGYENPLVFSNVTGTHQALAMVVKGEGKNRFRGVIITPKDSDIHTLADLKHKKIMIVGKTSAGGFLSQKISLTQIGFDLEKDCDIEEASDNKQENVIIAVSIGDADAGFIRESAFHIADAYIPPGSVKIMAPSAWLPNWALSVNRAMPEETKAKIKAALLALPANHPLLGAMQIEGFNAATDADYDMFRNLK